MTLRCFLHLTRALSPARVRAAMASAVTDVARGDRRPLGRPDYDAFYRAVLDRLGGRPPGGPEA